MREATPLSQQLFRQTFGTGRFFEDVDGLRFLLGLLAPFFFEPGESAARGGSGSIADEKDEHVREILCM